MRIGELARSVNVTVETIRYYQRIGLLGLPARPYGGTRSYRFEDLQRLHFIRRAQQIVVFQEAVAKGICPLPEDQKIGPDCCSLKSTTKS